MAKAKITTLARWLGPWAKPHHIPRGVESDDVSVPGPADRPPVRVRRWWRDAQGPALVVWPGLHYAGPADPRMDRFCRILAASGYRVFSPFLSDYLDLQLRPSVLDDALAVVDGLGFDRPVGTLSISFGCLPAAYVAAQRPERVAGLLIFGGYAQWDAAMRFSLTGGNNVPHDPLNHPVSFMNLVEYLPGAPDPTPLLAAWRQYIEATWGKVEMKAADAWPKVVREVATHLPPALQPVFLRGCGLAPGALGVVEQALKKAGPRDWLDPRPHLARVQCPVVLVHGMDDDVIPHSQAPLLEAAIPEQFRAGMFITGLYGHTGHGASSLGLLRRELGSMVGILKALARLGG